MVYNFQSALLQTTAEGEAEFSNPALKDIMKALS
jgi:hypothetical protein